MKTVSLICLLLCLAPNNTPAQSPQPAPRLTGIINLMGEQRALLELTVSHRSWTDYLILSPGHGQEGVVVTGFLPGQGSVELLLQGTNAVTVGLETQTNVPVSGMVLEKAGLEPVLELFAQFTNRSLLRWPNLPKTHFSLIASAADRAGAGRLLAEALVARNLALIPDGDKFLMVVPQSEIADAKPHAPTNRPAPRRARPASQPSTLPGRASTQPASRSAEPEEVMPAGNADFRQADVLQVVKLYTELLGRDLVGSEFDPRSQGQVTFRTQTPITKEECIYALETLLRWQGIELVAAGDHALKAVPAAEH